MCAGGATTQDTKRAAAGSKPNIEHKALELQEVFLFARLDLICCLTITYQVLARLQDLVISKEKDGNISNIIL